MAGNPIPITGAGLVRNWTFRDLLGLVKCHLGLYIALTAVAGHALALNGLSLAGLELGAWVLVLSLGAGVLNNVQDRRLDRDVARTQNRILARGDLSSGAAMAAGLILLATGLSGLFLRNISMLSGILGAVAVICYNGIYTPMKQQGTRARFLAMVPGTLCGMLPPAIGWTAVEKGLAGHDLSGLLIFMAGLGLWQFPHFLLVWVKEQIAAHGSRPNGPLGSEQDALHQVVIWSALFSISQILFLLRGWLDSGLLSFMLLALSLGLPVFLAILFPLGRLSGRRTELGFWALNFSMLIYTVLILLDRL